MMDVMSRCAFGWRFVDMDISRPCHRTCHMHNSETDSSSMFLDKRFDFLCNTKETAFVRERAGVTPFSIGNHQRHKPLSWSRYRTRGHYEQLRIPWQRGRWELWKSNAKQWQLAVVQRAPQTPKTLQDMEGSCDSETAGCSGISFTTGTPELGYT